MSLLNNASTNTSASQQSLLSQQQQQQSSSSSNRNSSATTHSRGLAAIPLLCAAASEQRGAYLRRLQTAPTAWWRRQEPLAAPPGSLAALPETCLLTVATLLERLALHCGSGTNNNNNTSHKGNSNNNINSSSSEDPPAVWSAVVQSGLWPLHNALLAVWMAVILWSTLVGAVADLLKTIVLGSRRTGRTLASIWHDDVAFGRSSVQTLTEPHQPVAARCV